MVLEKTKYEIKLAEKQRQNAEFVRWIKWKSPGVFIKNYVGADISFVRDWIERMFIGDMSWDNYGSVWVIDHIVPFRMFDVFKVLELKLVWNYRNLMPIFNEDNLKKQGNTFFCFELLYKHKDKDLIYKSLYEKIKPETEWMMKYVDNYNTKTCF